jgi:hypothetical protein
MAIRRSGAHGFVGIGDRRRIWLRSFAIAAISVGLLASTTTAAPATTLTSATTTAALSARARIPLG